MNPVDLNQLIAQFTSFYNENKFNPALNQLTNFLLENALKARGYNNFETNNVSGEKYFIEHILAPTNPKICIDVGANVGEYTQELLTNTEARVIAFEPLSLAFEKLKQTTSRYSNRVTLEKKGVGRTSDELPLFFNPNATYLASFSEDVKKIPWLNNHQYETVSITTLDDYCAENNISRIDLLKIDTEGYETEVLAGAKRTLQDIRPRFIQIEFNIHQMFRGVTLQHFSEILPTYEVYQLLPTCWAKRDPKDPLANIYMYSNFIFKNT